MDASTLQETFSRAVVAGCLAVSVALALACLVQLARVACRWSARTIRKVGVATFLVIGILAAWATVVATPTLEDKSDAASRREGEAERNRLLDGGMVPDRFSTGWQDVQDERDDGPVVRPLTDADYAAGFALARIGTGEAWDFAPPPGAAVSDDWTRFGAARDWFRVSWHAGDGEWGAGLPFPFGTDTLGALTVHSGGFARPSPANAATFISPLGTDLGIVPESDWPLLPFNQPPATNHQPLITSPQPSQFWHHLTPSNTFVMTWRNVLLGRDPASPVSFQAELFGNGDVMFRYDLSRLAADPVTNVVVGIRADGLGRTFASLPRATTSLRWTRLDGLLADDPDPDGDGIPTADEVFTYFTDPYRADTDLDGLSDYDEVNVHHTDPLDAHSVSMSLCDGFAVKLGEVDPFSFPEGSTNTVLEHLFYTGTTNEPFFYPASTRNRAVLRVSATGAGAGDLLVDGVPVPLLGAPSAHMAPARNAAARDAPAPGAGFTLPVPKGRRVRLSLRALGACPAFELDADEFAAGVLPREVGADGWIVFPNTAASPACIHDLYSKSVTVSLDPGAGAEALVCDWRNVGMSDFVDVARISDLSARLTARFGSAGHGRVAYTLSHPDYLFGRTEYGQKVRFCPRPPEAEEDEDDDFTDDSYTRHEDDHGPGGGEGGGSGEAPGGSDGEDGPAAVTPWSGDASLPGPGSYWELDADCWCRAPGSFCTVDCTCSCHGLNPAWNGSSDDPVPGGGTPSGGGDGGDGPASGGGEGDGAASYVAYDSVAESESYDRAKRDAAGGSTRLANVLLLEGADPEGVPVRLDVPSDSRTEGCTCPCPAHAGNFVSLAYRSPRVSVMDASGGVFLGSSESCTVRLHGVSPSADFGGDVVQFSRNGGDGVRCDCTVLGLGIEHRTLDLAAVDALSSVGHRIGMPMVVATNAAEALELVLRTDVDLPSGTVRLALGEASSGTRFRVWLGRNPSQGSLLLDSSGQRALNLPVASWRMLARGAGTGRCAPVRITADRPGRCSLVFGYAGTGGGKSVAFETNQVVTAVEPPLLADYDRDGRIGASDRRAWLAGKKLYFWSNRDTWRGDDAFAGVSDHFLPPDLPCNGDDDEVNGRNDLVNLCPMKIDFRTVLKAWGTAKVKYEFLSGSVLPARFVPVRMEWSKVHDLYYRDLKTPDGADLRSAMLTEVAHAGTETPPYEIPAVLLDLGRSETGALAVEFAEPGEHRLKVRVCDASTGAVLLEHTQSFTVLDVHDMFRWINLMGACGKTVDAKYDSRASEPLWPDDAHADANVVFVHGYNMHESEAWDWSAQVFKRLWCLGMDAGFSAVLWRGNEQQLWVPYNGWVTKNYHQAVLNAFRTAAGFSEAFARIPGERKYVAAHSLGNMLVSVAAERGLVYERYFMLNAAVPLEAYDSDCGVTDESHEKMTPAEWRPYADFLRSSHWFELPFGNADDFRRGLTWKGCFRHVGRAVNFYSPSDEVVGNGDGDPADPLSRELAWYNQERAKGSRLVSIVPEAGWAFGDDYLKRSEKPTSHVHGEPVYGLRKYNAAEAATIAPTNLIERPFFDGFSRSALKGAGGDALLRNDSVYRWRVLTHGIPAESFATGANRIPKFTSDSTARANVNIDMSAQCAGSESVPKNAVWTHSYFIQKPLSDTGRLYSGMVEAIGAQREDD